MRSVQRGSRTATTIVAAAPATAGTCGTPSPRRRPPRRMTGYGDGPPSCRSDDKWEMRHAKSRIDVVGRVGGNGARGQTKRARGRQHVA